MRKWLLNLFLRFNNGCIMINDYDSPGRVRKRWQIHGSNCKCYEPKTKGSASIQVL
jgi:hypothetical protein